jgi:hypothetical protein
VIDAWLVPETKALLRPILPYSIILRNDSQRSIACVTVVWKLRNPEGTPIRHTYSYYNVLIDPRTFIQPGEMLFMGPVSGVPRKVVIGGKRAQTIAGAWSWRDQGLFANQERVVVALDSVTSDDGTIIGPDEARSMLRINETMRADNELAAEVLKLDDGAVERLLTSAKDQGSTINDAIPGADTAYYSRRAQVADSLLKVIAHEGVSRARAILQATSESRRIPIVHRKGNIQ